jgi:Eukaryotic protein of unknown function (DUF842)
MSSSAAQAKAQALNAKLEAEARVTLDEIDQKHARKLARQSHVCAVACYDKAGSTGLGDALEHCVNQCQMPYRQGNAMVQQVRNMNKVFFKYHHGIHTRFFSLLTPTLCYW